MCKLAIALIAGALLCSTTNARADQSQRIDREALVRRHNPTLAAIDPSSPLMVGNGDIAFTADITGLQTFPEQYSPLVPLMTQAQWAWHNFPNPQRYDAKDGVVPIEIRGRTRHYAWLEDWSAADGRPAIAWLRENPHRFSLGRLSLYMVAKDGQPAAFAELSQTRQTLDMWTGVLASRFVLDGREVYVETSVHPELDMIIVKLESPLLAESRLGVDVKFPGVAAKLNPDPADWTRPDAHVTKIVRQTDRAVAIERQLDATRYYVDASVDRPAKIESIGPHHLRVLPSEPTQSMTLLVAFSEQKTPALPSAEEARAAVARHWHGYWQDGGVIDLSRSTDPRAHELERRIVLSQYLMALNAAGTLPPQEEGLFSNSWNGKFHLEMHPWHAAHFAIWGRTKLLERSMPWYLEHLPEAKARAKAQGVRGAWWPKMVGPEGRESPSTVNPFIMWQQPHPIYLAELIYRDRQNRETLNRYRELVFETAELLASFVHFDKASDRYVLGPPVIPVQEVFPPLETFNPTFELAYYRFGLETAQRWRERLGLARVPEWDRVLEKLSPLPQRDGVYLATESFPQLWDQARSAECSNGRTAPECWNRDHPSFLMALGLLPAGAADDETMRRTLRAVEQHWDLRQTWGWDFPMIAMTATRLHEPETAIAFLFHESKNNQFGVSGMTPRVHFEAHADHFVPNAPSTGAGTDGPGYKRAAETYFPSNGSLLLAVGLMAAGWDGESTPLPGFPKNDRWVVRTEGLRPLP